MMILTHKQVGGLQTPHLPRYRRLFPQLLSAWASYTPGANANADARQLSSRP